MSARTSLAPGGAGAGAGASIGAGAGIEASLVPATVIELAVGDGSTAINLGDADAVETAIADAASDPALAASVEAALGALASQVRDMQARLLAMKSAAACAPTPAAVRVPGSSAKVVGRARPSVQGGAGL